MCHFGKTQTLSWPGLTSLQGIEGFSLIFMPLESCLLCQSHEKVLQMLLREIDAECNIDEASSISSFGPGLHCSWDFTKWSRRKIISKGQCFGDKKRITCSFNVFFSCPGSPIQKKAQKLESWPAGSQHPPFSYWISAECTGWALFMKTSRAFFLRG